MLDVLTRRLAERLHPDGLDLVQAFGTAVYDRWALARGLHRLPGFGRDDAGAVLIGNTRALWAPFVAALPPGAHPLDAYVVDRVDRARAALGVPSEVRFAHDGGDRLVSMLRLAHLSGLAHLGPAHLAVHPQHGPWFALRAVVVFDVDPPGVAVAAPDPCSACPEPCVAAMHRAGADWRSWLAVRDACPQGRASRYGEAQIRYHYTKTFSGGDP